MKTLKPAMFALLAAMAFAAPAFAQEGGMMRENEFRIVMANGQTKTTMMTDAKAIDEIMKHAKPLAAGQVFFMHNGKTYMVEDMKMPDGRLLSEHLGSRA